MKKRPTENELRLAEAIQLLVRVLSNASNRPIPELHQVNELAENVIAGSGPAKPQKTKKLVQVMDDPCLEDEFAKLWPAWKGRPNNPKKPALEKYKKLRRSGVAAKELFAATKAYYFWCKEEGVLGTNRMLQAQTFFGPNERYKADFTIQQEGPSELGDDQSEVEY
jgi:hypothetical protein